MKCYLCGIDLTESNSSREHIIPNALGGKLVTRILCKECNSHFGQSCDAQLAKSLEFFSFFVKPKRHHGVNPPVRLSLNGHPVKAYPNGVFKSFPKVERISDKKINVVSYGNNAKQQVESFFDNLLKKGKIQSDEYRKIREKLKAQQVSSVKNPILKTSIFLENIWLGLLKIAVNYSILNKINPIYLQDDIEILKKQDQSQCCLKTNYFYPENLFPANLLCHTIILIGDNSEEKLYCLISLYGVLNVVVLLNAKYSDANFVHSYCFNVLDDQKISFDSSKLKHTSINWDEVLDFSEEMRSRNFKKLEERLQWFMDFFVHKNYDKEELTLNILSLAEKICEEFSKRPVVFNEKNFLICFTREFILRKQEISQNICFKDLFFEKLFQTHSSFFFSQYMQKKAQFVLCGIVGNVLVQQILRHQTDMLKRPDGIKQMLSQYIDKEFQKDPLCDNLKQMIQGETFTQIVAKEMLPLISRLKLMTNA